MFLFDVSENLSLKVVLRYDNGKVTGFCCWWNYKQFDVNNDGVSAENNVYAIDNANATPC
jgi:hypothetical protein